MADPFSIAVSAISLAAIFKEVVELAQRLVDSFQKISRNEEQASRLLSSVLERSKNLQKFSDNHAETLETAHDLKEAILDIRREMDLVYEKIKAFDAIPCRGRFRSVGPIFNAWLDRNKVETDIKQLDDHMKDCCASFMDFVAFQTNVTALQVNVRTRQILESTTRLEASKPTVDQILVATTAIEQKVSFLVDASQSEEHSCHADARQKTTNLKIMQKSQSLSFSKSATAAETISIQVAAEVYLHYRIVWIDQSFTKFVRSQTFANEEPMELFTKPFYTCYTVGDALPDDHPLRHDGAFSLARSITHVLQRHHVSPAMQQGAIDMRRLSIELCKLHMHHENIPVCRWTADLFRTLLNAGPIVYQPYLCLALQSLALNHSTTGNISEASNTIAACLRLSRELPGIFGSHEMQNMLAYALIASSRIAREGGDSAKALTDAVEAISIYENIFKEIPDWKGLDPFSPLSGQFKGGKDDNSCVTHVVAVQAEAGVNDDIDDEHSISTATTDAEAQVVEDVEGISNNELTGIHAYIYNYACALRRLSDARYDLFQYQESSESELRSSNITEQFDLLYHSNFSRQNLASAYYRLTRAGLRDYVQASDALIYAKKAVDIYRDLSMLSQVDHPNYFCAMEAYAMILRGLKQYDKALEILQEMAWAAEEIVDDQHKLADSLRDISEILRALGREDEAASLKDQSVATYRMVFKATSRDEGESNLQLATHLRKSGWHQDAVEAYQEAVIHYRILAMDDDMESLARALVGLASCFVSLKQYDRALDEGRKALRLLENPVDDGSSALPLFREALRINMDAAFHSDNELKSMEQSQHCIHQYRRIFKLYPDQTRHDMADALEKHVFKLNEHHKTLEAIRWSNETIEWHEAQPIPRLPILEYHRLLAYAVLGDGFMKLGQMDKALRVTNQVIEIRKNQEHAKNSVVATVVYGALRNRTQILLSLGQSAEALDSSVDTIHYTETNLPLEDRAVAYSHKAYATARSGSHGDSVTAAEEAVRICRLGLDSEVDPLSHDPLVPIRFPWCLRGLADALADAGQVERALDQARKGYTMISDCKATKTDILPSAYIEPEFLPSHLVFAVQLFANGDNESAASHLEELVSSVKESAKTRPGYYPIYANALRILGWCHCSLGQHENGERRSVELSNLCKKLQLVYPHISELVDIELAADIKRPSRLALWKKINLQCGHHHWDGEKVGE